MTSHFTLKTLLRQASRQLLATYLDQSGIDLGLDLASLKARDVDPIVDSMNHLRDDQRATMDRDLHAIWSLNSEAGLRHLLAEAADQSADILEKLAPLDSFLDKSLWTFLHARCVFDGAATFAIQETLPGRYWKRHLPVSGGRPSDIAGRTTALEHALRDFFQREEARGRSCKVDYHARASRHWYFSYPEDYASAPLAWSQTGLGRHILRPAFEVIFVYDDAQASLDLYIQRPGPTVDRLRKLFAEVVLDIPDLPPATKPAYALEGLGSRSFTFVRPPGSPIVDARVTRLAYALSAGPPTKISVELDQPGNAHALHSEIDRVFAQGQPLSGLHPLATAKLIGAKVKATIDLRDGKRLKARTFDLSPKSCSLKYDGIDLSLRQMLVDSGIDQTGRPSDAGSIRPSSQLAAE